MTVERFAGDPPSPWEVEYGFSRLVRAGDLVMVGGTTSVDELGFVIGINPFEQATEVFRKLLSELSRAGVSADAVISTHAYVTDISRSAEVGRAFADAFSSVRPLLTMVEVSALIDPRMLVEIEATAYVPAGPAATA